MKETPRPEKGFKALPACYGRKEKMGQRNSFDLTDEYVMFVKKEIKSANSQKPSGWQRAGTVLFVSFWLLLLSGVGWAAAIFLAR